MVTTAVAKRLYVAFIAAEDTGKRPIDLKIAVHVFEALVEMVHAFGVGSTPFHVKITVMETVTPVLYQRPGYGTVNNSVQQNFDAAVVANLVTALNHIADAA